MYNLIGATACVHLLWNGRQAQPMTKIHKSATEKKNKQSTDDTKRGAFSPVKAK